MHNRGLSSLFSRTQPFAEIVKKEREREHVLLNGLIHSDTMDRRKPGRAIIQLPFESVEIAARRKRVETRILKAGSHERMIPKATTYPSSRGDRGGDAVKGLARECEEATEHVTTRYCR